MNNWRYEYILIWIILDFLSLSFLFCPYNNEKCSLSQPFKWVFSGKLFAVIHNQCTNACRLNLNIISISCHVSYLTLQTEVMAQNSEFLLVKTILYPANRRTSSKPWQTFSLSYERMLKHKHYLYIVNVSVGHSSKVFTRFRVHSKWTFP